jgi:AcrR family transcriptional regulator
MQQRSIESMNRMLDAGEQLFSEGGSSAVTLESVIERAETSTGSFYARFGDMRGFLDSMHQRALGRLAAELEPVFARASMEDDLESALLTLISEGFEVVHRHRESTYFFAVGNSHDPEWREIGAQFSLGMNDVLCQIMKRFVPKSSSAAAKRRIDMAARMIHAATFQQIMLEQEELSRLTHSPKTVASELAMMFSRYVLDSPAS